MISGYCCICIVLVTVLIFSPLLPSSSPLPPSLLSPPSLPPLLPFLPPLPSLPPSFSSLPPPSSSSPFPSLLQDVLHDVPDFEERKKLLSELKNRLEALLSPQLISSFQTHSLAEAKRYVTIFTGIHRYPQLKNYYIGCHKVRSGAVVFSLKIFAEAVVSAETVKFRCYTVSRVD